MMNCLLVLQVLFSLLVCVKTQSTRRVLTAQVCEGEILNLSCEAGNVINVEHVILADSDCIGSSNCCPDLLKDCTSQPSEGHRNAVLNACNGRQTCAIRSVKEMTLCRVFLVRVKNDYERVTYYCDDVDECSPTHSNAARRCSPQATCTNSPGSFKCRCKEGYVGDGFNCTLKETSPSPSTSLMTTDGVGIRGVSTSEPTTMVVLATESNDAINSGSLVGSSDENEADVIKSLTSTQILAILLGVVGLVLLLVSVNMILWCRLKHQRRRRRVSEKQLELTLRRGATTVGSGFATSSLTGNGGSGCSGRPMAIVRAVDQCSGATSCGEKTNSDATCSGANVGVVCEDGARPYNANQYEKLDYATARRPVAPPCGQPEQDYRETCLPLPPSSSSRYVQPSCRAAEPSADDACCSAVGYEGEGCYEDLDDYLKPMTEMDECGQTK